MSRMTEAEVQFHYRNAYLDGVGKLVSRDEANEKLRKIMLSSISVSGGHVSHSPGSIISKFAMRVKRCLFIIR